MEFVQEHQVQVVHQELQVVQVQVVHQVHQVQVVHQELMVVVVQVR